MSKLLIYIKSILVPLLIGGLVGIVTSKYIDYTSLLQPSWAPPSFLFPIVWTILYILMGISYGILKSNSLLDSKTSNIYYLQLFVNALWSIFFFVFKWRLFSFVWILLLIVLKYGRMETRTSHIVRSLFPIVDTWKIRIYFINLCPFFRHVKIESTMEDNV